MQPGVLTALGVAFRLSALLLALMFVAPIQSRGQAAANGKLQIHHIDMGQGDSAILISPGGETVLFDAGEDIAKQKTCSSIMDYLDQAGVTEIDYLFVSHYHSDHIGCVPTVLAKFPLQHEAFDRGMKYASTQYNNYVTAVGTHRTTAVLGHTITLDAGTSHEVTVTVKAFDGTFSGGSVPAKDENDVSLSALVSFGAFREEIGGDLSGQKTGIYVDVESGAAPSVGALDVYKVHHHCSSHSSNATWMADTVPTVAVISVGLANDYGHPTADCLARLHNAHVAEVYWTEKGNGAPPANNDVIGGDIVIEVPAESTTYTVTHNDAVTETYRIKGSPSPTAPDTPTSPDPSPSATMFAWSTKSRYYYDSSCSAVSRISHANLQTGTTPPADKTYHPCSGN